MCRHCDKHGYTCSILSLPHLFPFLSFLLHASQSLFPFTSSLLPRHPPLCYFPNWNSGAEAQPPSPPQGQGAGWNHWMETVHRGPSELKVSSNVVWRPNKCIQPPHPSGLNITHHTPLPHHKPEKRQIYTNPSKVCISDLTISLVGSLNSAGILVRVQPKNRKH